MGAPGVKVGVGGIVGVTVRLGVAVGDGGACVPVLVALTEGVAVCCGESVDDAVAVAVIGGACVAVPVAAGVGVSLGAGAALAVEVGELTAVAVAVPVAVSVGGAFEATLTVTVSVNGDGSAKTVNISTYVPGCENVADVCGLLASANVTLPGPETIDHCTSSGKLLISRL
jgi:hypothetical protein